MRWFMRFMRSFVCFFMFLSPCDFKKSHCSMAQSWTCRMHAANIASGLSESMYWRTGTLTQIESLSSRQFLFSTGTSQILPRSAESHGMPGMCWAVSVLPKSRETHRSLSFEADGLGPLFRKADGFSPERSNKMSSDQRRIYPSISVRYLNGLSEPTCLIRFVV